MNIEILQEFLFWSMVINFGIYTLTAIAVITLRNTVYKIHKVLFGLDEESVSKSIQNYLANYKLLITFFNFVPWLAIVITK